MAVKAIEKKTVHQICSGQVVLSLAIAVKELVENALDAGATNIEVRVKEHGGDLVEVLDNGSGVEERNFQGLALKHHTSKIRDFADLEVGLSTFGFRGEALSSLCALSNMTICTCHKSSGVGAKLEYDNNGLIRSRTSFAREVGTTVSLSQLFHTLPVRHKEFHRNKKKEFNKMLHMLEAYCIVSTSVRISCFHQTGKSKKQLVLSTSGNSDIQGNILDVFGTKQLKQLLTLPTLSVEELTDHDSASHLRQEDLERFRFSGYVSRCNLGQGRSSTDRQFYFFNGRPCDHPKLARMVNEVYHSFNRQQYPCVILNIGLSKECLDVNVAPDKRRVMLQEEVLMLLIVKVLLFKLWEPTQGQYESQTLVKAKTTPRTSEVPLPTQPENSPATPSLSKFVALKRNFDPKHQDVNHPVKQMKLGDTRHFVKQSLPEKSSSDIVSSSMYDEEDEELEEAPILGKAYSLSEFPPAKDSVPTSDGGRSSKKDSKGDRDCGKSGEGCSKSGLGERDHYRGNSDTNVRSYAITELASSGGGDLEAGKASQGREESFRNSCSINLARGEELPSGNLDCPGNPGPSECGPLVSKLSMSSSSDSKTCSETRSQLVERMSSGVEKGNDNASVENQARKNPKKKTISELDSSATSKTPSGGEEVTVVFDLEAVSGRLKALATGSVASESLGGRSEGLRFRAKINPNSNMAAEDELRREIKKSDFLKMKIIGQFNLGFIITKLGSDLFIVDQHATDEKFNFERLQRETVIKHQNLLAPKALELTAVSECVIISNLKVFEMNGFLFQVDENAPPMHKLKLLTKPVSKNWSMEKNEIDELVFLLSDDGGSSKEVVRPSAVRAMFASRACRSSIMIGTALRESDMRKLLDHMSQTDQPWNCPHGRPTMRHLISLDRIKLN